jgi:hypothetical protein
MQYFVINECTYKGCANWRVNNTCIKDSMDISAVVRFAKLLPDSKYCEVTNQINKYKLNELLEG